MTVSGSRFAEVYDHFYGNVYAFCRRRVGPDRVDDAVAETFLTVWRRIDSVPDGDDALLWVYRVAYRVVGHTWRSVSRGRKLEQRLSSLGVEVHAPAEDFVLRSEDEKQALSAAAMLSNKDAEVLRLSIWEQLSNRQIASVLDLSEGAVKQRLHRAKRNLTRQYNRLERKPQKSHAAQEGGAW